MIRRPTVVLNAWCSPARTGSLPPQAPYSIRHFGVWRPYFGELLTEWLRRIGLPAARYGSLPPTGAARIGILLNQRKLVICTPEDPPEIFLAVFLALVADVPAIIAASEYVPPRQPWHRSRITREGMLSLNGKA